MSSFLRQKLLPKFVLLNTRIVVGSYTALTLPIYALTQKPWATLKESRRQRVTVEKSADGSYSYYKRFGPPVTHPDGYHLCHSVKEILTQMRKIEDPETLKLASREVFAEKLKLDANGEPLKIDGKVTKELTLAREFKWLNSRAVFRRLDNLVKGFDSMGVKTRQKVIIFADTRLEWFLSSLALFELDSIIVTLFSNLGQEGLIFGMKQTQAQHVVTSYDLLPRIASFIHLIPNIKTIFYMRHPFQETFHLPEFPPDVKVIPLDEVENVGSKIEKIPQIPLPHIDDVSMIMYTSGTTGVPKAVILENRQVKAALIALTSNVNDLADEAHRHVYATFLPLAHIMGLTFELFHFTGGVKIGYCTPMTLTDTSPSLANGQEGDLKVLQPTVIIAVPLILDRIIKEIYNKLAARSPILPPFFTYLMDYKIRWTKRGFDTPIINALICKRVQEQFGGKLEFVVSGGAPLNTRTEDLIRAVLNVKLMQGYGSTETTGGVFGVARDDLDSGMAGYPLEGVRVKVESWPEGGYTDQDKPNPRGEIMISSDGVAQAYYKLDTETQNAFTTCPDGMRWFSTGDIGEIFPNGSVKIIDRKKDLAKLPNGEYISLGKIETTVKSVPVIENACVCISNVCSSIVALITPNDKQLRILAGQLGKSHMTREELCKDPELINYVQKNLEEICEETGLHRRETPVRITLTPQEWTPDNELLTAAFKLKRKNVLSFYAAEIEKLFDGLR